MSDPLQQKLAQENIPWFRDPKIRAYLIQTVSLLLVLSFLYYIFYNTVTNLNARGIQTGFSFLNEIVPFGIGFSPFHDFELGTSKYWEVFVIGIQNTLLVSLFGILAATLLGFFVGICRLSDNWLISKIASFYIETFRNIPVLLQIMFWNFAVFLSLLPSPRKSLSLGEMVFLNNSGLRFPAPEFDNTLGGVVFIISIILAIFLIKVFSRFAKRKLDEEGKVYPRILGSIGLFILLPLFSLLLVGWPISFDMPVLGKFIFEGGLEIPLPLFSLWFALTVYTSSFIAENVRGGILAVSKGQIEAASSLGLKKSVYLRLVVIPQAMRVIIPPTISQYLNLTKNSSLAVAIAYEELVSVWAGISLNQTGQALIIIAMTFFVYETLSFLTSLILNVYNKKVQHTER